MMVHMLLGISFNGKFLAYSAILLNIKNVKYISTMRLEIIAELNCIDRKNFDQMIMSVMGMSQRRHLIRGSINLT